MKINSSKLPALLMSQKMSHDLQLGRFLLHRIFCSDSYNTKCPKRRILTTKADMEKSRRALKGNGVTLVEDIYLQE